MDEESSQHTPVALRRQAVQVAFNDKFSLVAIGLNRYGSYPVETLEVV